MASKKKLSDNTDDVTHAQEELLSNPIQLTPTQPKPKKQKITNTPNTTHDAEDSKRYTKKELRQHMLDLPDTYIGSVVPGELETWVCEPNLEHTSAATTVTATHSRSSSQASNLSVADAGPLITLKKITVTMGLYKIIDEILQNAADNVPRTRADRAKNPDVALTTQIKINWEDDGSLSVYNNGEGIPIVEHTEHKVLIPTLIFGELLTSGNYDPNEARRWGGKNGYGSKAVSIYSSRFTVETIDRTRQKKFVQTWTNNMSECKPAKVTSYSGQPYTKITFLPDYPRFGCTNLTPDLKALLTRRAYDLAGTTGAHVHLNGTKLAVKHFQHFTELFLDKTIKRAYECVYDKTDPNVVAWEIVACPSPDGTFRHVSYVNFVSTFQGGHHVDWITQKLVKRICDQVNGKQTKKQTPLQPKHVKNNLWVFINASIVNPSFSSQTKECLTTSVSHLPACELSDGFVSKLIKTDLVERANALRDFHEQKLLVKTDGKKSRTVSGILKLEDANEAGGRHSRKCTLIVCEGDSARSFAVAGLGVLGRDFYGVYPLKGKIINVRDASIKQIGENTEINELKKIIGLREGVTDVNALRYGSLMVLTDEDVDGIHIKGLMINLFDVYWKAILKAGFVVSMYTPLVKVRKGSNVVASFFTERDFDAWKHTHSLHGLDVRYYKGLGTHDSTEARECFRQMRKIRYEYDDRAAEMVDLIFSKDKADRRKDWIARHQHHALDYTAQSVPISEFIDNGMIMHSDANNIRTIPSIMDGFKPSLRKIMCVMLRKGLSSIKVSQVTGLISADMVYHHGEASLSKSIVNMAQNFVGTNNINLLVPEGQFGTRLKGGEDAASGRYIHTKLESIARRIFKKEDDVLLTYRMEDGKQVEPEFYLPIVPMILVNGCSGIGTGFSTSIPCYNPLDIIRALRSILTTHSPEELVDAKPHSPHSSIQLVPWYRNFKGTITKVGTQWMSRGVWSWVTNASSKKNHSDKPTTTLHITELPLGVWSDPYKQFLESLLVGNDANDTKTKTTNANINADPKPKKLRQSKKAPIACVVAYKIGNRHDEQHVDITVEMNQHYSDEEVETLLKLSETVYCSETNMHLFDPHGHLIKFSTPMDILSAFCHYRLKYYEWRRLYQMQMCQRDKDSLMERVRFIKGILDNTLPILNKSKKEVCVMLQTHKFKPNPHKAPLVLTPISPQDWVDASEPFVMKNELYSRDYSYAVSFSVAADVFQDETADVTEPSSSALMSDYRYLVSTSVFQMTKEEIQRLQAECDRKIAEWDQLNRSSATQLWIDDLNQLELEWTKFTSP